LITAN